MAAVRFQFPDAALVGGVLVAANDHGVLVLPQIQDALPRRDAVEQQLLQRQIVIRKNNDLIKKTYSIFDGQHNPLDIEYCWMDREEYLIYKTFNELNSRFNLPLEGLLGNNLLDKENKDFDDKRELINSLDPIQE